MKRIFSLLMAIAILLSLCACQGNFQSVNLKDPIQLSEDGVVLESTVAQIKKENAIAVFAGTSGDLKYEWTLFGSSITTAKDINLALALSQTEDRIAVTLLQKEAFGFSASLSIHLKELWDAQSATAYAGDDAFSSVSLTGSDTTILNLNLDGTVGEFTIRPDPLPEDAAPPDDAKDEEASVPETETNDAPSQPEKTPEPSKPEEEGSQDKYHTDPIPEGKPKPVEPEDQEVDAGSSLSCTFSIECSTILNNLDKLDPAKLEMVPSGGVILSRTTVTFSEGESVFDVLQRLCRNYGIHLESSWTPMYNSAYIEGIHNLYEFDCGELSGWMYRVNGWYPNYGCSRYQLKDGDVVEWRFTCDLGNDIGGGYAAGG